MRCVHCQLEFPQTALFVSCVKGVDCYFCCVGCEQVYRLLHEQGLEDFYNKIHDTTLEPVVGYNDAKMERFASDGFIKKYVKVRDDAHEIALVLDKIHCAACMWLNEKVLNRAYGILKAHLNYTNHKAVILYDPKSTNPAQILKLIRQIGYDAHPYDPLLQEQHAYKIQRDFYTRMVVAVFCSMNIMWIAVAQYAGYFSGITEDMRFILNIASFCLCVPTLFFSGWIFWRGAFFSLRNGILSMDSLIISGSSIAFVYSIWASSVGKETYFESITMIITFVLIGRFLEQRGRKIAVDSFDSLNASIPLHITILRENQRMSITPEEAKIGDIVEVLAGEKIALDGILLSESALCDESMLSGESAPVLKAKNDKIYSGSIVVQAPLHYRITHDIAHSFLLTMFNLVQESLNHKPKIEEQANKLLRSFSLSVLVLATLTFVSWMAYGADISFAIGVAVSVIIIACPCAFALATPMASVIGIGNALSKKLIFKESRFLESLAQIDTIIFDKTGTLTQNTLTVNHAIGFDMLSCEQRRILHAMLLNNTHPVSKAVESFLEQQYSKEQEHACVLKDYEQLLGKGVRARYGSQEFIAGNLALLESYDIAFDDSLKEESRLLFCFARVVESKGELLAVFFIHDNIKDDAQISIKCLRDLGLRLCIASGDRLAPVARVAHELGITEFYAEQTPDKKAELIASLQASGRTILMVGDGINDTIAFATSNVAIAMGSGLDVAISVSDVIALDDSLYSIYEAICISHASLKCIKQNIVLSIVYNALSIPLAMAGFIIPLFAALSMSLSSLLVVGNSLRHRF